MSEFRLSDDQQLELRLEIAERGYADYINAFRRQRANNLILIDAIERVRAAIITAITDEDGLDGGEGELILEYIRQVLAANGATTVDMWGNELEPTP